MDFEQACDPNPKNGSTSSHKYSLRRVEPSLKKFIKVLHIDLERLKRHQINIEKYESSKDYVSLHKEQIYATRTVQQLKSNVKQLEQTRSQVIESDLGAFEKEVNDVQTEAVQAVTAFLRSHSHKSSENNPSPFGEDQLSSTDRLTDSSEALDPLQQDQLLISEGQDAATQESLDDLVTNLEELNGLIQTFSQLVHTQGEAVNTIEDNVEKASENVKGGKEHLRKAALLKATMYPVCGALLGGAVGGPVGLVAGLKLGGLAAAGGGIAGYAGGALLKRKVNTTTIEPDNLGKDDNQISPDGPTMCRPCQSSDSSEPAPVNVDPEAAASSRHASHFNLLAEPIGNIYSYFKP